MEKLVKPDLHIDADILAYQAASACDGRMYRVSYEVNGEVISVFEKYKKRADERVNELEHQGFEVTCEVEYTPDPFEEAVKVMRNTIVSMKQRLAKHVDGIGDCYYYVSRHGSFREKAYPTYKNNRKEIRRPFHLEACKDWLIKEKNAQCQAGELEADDLMAMAMTANPNSVICSIDKDLLQVPGHHWNWKRGTYSVVDEEEGRRSLYTQMLTGDTSDGIPGIHKVGPVTAKKALVMVSSEFMMYCVVLKMYIDKTPLQSGEINRTDPKFQQRMVDLVEAHATLLYLLRYEGDKWEAPKNE